MTTKLSLLDLLEESRRLLLALSNKIDSGIDVSKLNVCKNEEGFFRMDYCGFEEPISLDLRVVPMEHLFVGPLKLVSERFISEMVAAILRHKYPVARNFTPKDIRKMCYA